MRPSLVVLAASAVMAGCFPPQPSLRAQAPERCALASFIAQGADSFSVPLLPEDSLDAKVEPRSLDIRRVDRPPGFPLGFRADVLVVLIIDTTGHVVSATPVASDIQRTRAVGPGPFDLREGFEGAAVDFLAAEAYAVPRRNGRPVMAAVCRPFSFRER